MPIGGAERNDVAGEGKATATLSGSKLSVTGSFDGLPAKATGAKLHHGVAKGARGAGTAIGDLRVTGGASGTVSGDVRLSAEQVEALKAGRLYLQIYSEKGVLPDHATLFGWLASEGVEPMNAHDARARSLLVGASQLAARARRIRRSRSRPSKPPPAARRSRQYCAQCHGADASPTAERDPRRARVRREVGRQARPPICSRRRRRRCRPIAPARSRKANTSA